MDCVHRIFGPLGANQAGQAYFRCTDDFDVDPCARQGAEHPGRHAGAAQHACTNNRDFGHIFVDHNPQHSEVGGHFFENVARLVCVALGNGKHDIVDFLVCIANALYDHVNIDIGFGQCGEHPERYARLVRHSQNRRFGHIQVMRHTAHDKIFFFHRVSLPDHCSRLGCKGRADMNRHAVTRP